MRFKFQHSRHFANPEIIYQVDAQEVVVIFCYTLTQDLIGGVKRNTQKKANIIG